MHIRLMSNMLATDGSALENVLAECREGELGGEFRRGVPEIEGGIDFHQIESDKPA